jgi:hypothetical protein
MTVQCTKDDSKAVVMLGNDRFDPTKITRGESTVEIERDEFDPGPAVFCSTIGGENDRTIIVLIAQHKNPL